MRSESGFTLIEVILTVGILLTITGTFVIFQRDLLFTNRFLNTFYIAQADATDAIDMMVKEIRAASESAIGGYPIEKASGSNFSFFADINGDDTPERVMYFISQGRLKKSVISPAGTPLTYSTTTAQEDISILIADIISTSTTPIFLYYKGDYVGTSTPLTEPINIASIRHVGIDLRLPIANPSTGTTTALFSGNVTIRTLKFRGSLVN